MQRIFNSPSLVKVTQLKDALEGAGIACFIRNEILSGLTGAIPLEESTPELWQYSASLVSPSMLAGPPPVASSPRSPGGRSRSRSLYSEPGIVGAAFSAEQYAR